MLRIPGILTRAKDKKQVVLSLNLTQKIILTLLVAASGTVLLGLGLARVHSAPANVASPPFLQPPSVVLNVPSEVLIGEDFEFEVRLKNNPGNPIGYAPYVELYLPASGVDGNSLGHKCDGITFLSARALFTSPPSLTLPVALDTGMDPSLNPCPNSYGTHPFNGANIFTPPLQYNPTPIPQYQLVVIPLPFGSFDPTQPENIIKVKARLSDYADAGMPLTIYAKGGFRYGTDEKDNHSSDPLVESAPISAQTTPTLLKIKKEYLGPEDEAVSGPNFVNYYPLKYKVTVDIADQQEIQNLVVTDKLPANLQFNGNVQVTIQGNNANVVTSCSATPGPFDVVIATPSSTPGGTLSVTLCTFLKGSTAPDDVVVTFDFFIPDVDANGQIIISKDCSNAPVAVKNDILAAGDWDPRDPRDPLPTDPAGTTVPVNSNLTNVDHLLNAKCLAIQKSVKMFQEFPGGANGPTPGDVLRYELNFQVSDYFTIGKLVVTDFLADGQTFVGPPPTIRVSDLFGNTGAPTAFPVGTVTTTLNQPPAAASCPVIPQTPQLGTIVRFDVSLAMLFLPPFIPRQDAGMLTGGLAAGPPTSTPATGTIVFYAKINDAFKPPVSALHKFVDKHDPINNCVNIKGAVYGNLPRPTPLNAPLNIPTSIIGSAVDGSAVQTTIVGADLVKTVWAVRRGTSTLCGPATINATSTSCSNLPNAPEEVRPGDRVTFRLEKPFPSGDSENVTIEDWLPLPIFKVSTGNSFNNFACAGLPGPGISCLGPTDTLHTLVAPAKPVFIPDVPTNRITFTYGDFNNTANTSLKIDLLFTYTVTNQPFADDLFMTNEARECEDNSFGVTFCQVSIAQVKVREPKLQIKKGVVATDNPHGVFTPALNPSGVWKPFGSSCPDFQNGPITSGTLGGLINSNLSNVDANDQVTFGIGIENTGGAPACEIELADIIPLDPLDKPSCFDADFSGLCITDGSGTQIPFTTAIGGHGRKIIKLAPGFCLAPGSPANTTGTNIAIVTFNAQLHSDITPGCCDNVAQLLHYTSQSGGPNFVDAGFAPPFSDNATVCVNPTLTKTLVSTSEPHTVGSDVTIGEIARYRLAVVVPEGGVLPNFQVTDALPAGMRFLNDGSARLAFISNSSGITHPFPPVSSTAFNVNGNELTLSGLTFNSSQTVPATAIIGGAACGAPVTFNLGNIQNNDNNDPDLELIVIEFNALVCNEIGNQSGTPLSNTFSVSVGGTQIATSNPVNVNIVEPNFTLTKTVAPNPAVKGQTLTYTVQYSNNGTADAFNVELKDTLPPGLTLGTVTATCPFTNVPLNTLTVTCAQIPKAPNPGSTVIVTYQVLANPETCPVTLENRANLKWTSLPGLQGTTVNPTGSSTPGSSGAVDGERDGVTPLLTLNDYAATDSAPVKIDCPCEAMITGMKFNDLNGNGVRDTGEPGLANWTIQVTNSSGVTHTTTTNSQGNYSFTVPAPGTYTVAEVLQSGWTQTAPTAGTYSVTVSPGQIITNRNFGNRKKKGCDLQITKEVKPNPLVSGQQATATVIVKNVGTSPCHGPTQVAESMPAGLTLVSASVPGGNCVVATGICTYPPAILPGASVVFTYVFNVTAQPGTKFENCARLKNSDDKNSANNSTCIPLTVSDVKLPDLTIQKKVQCDGPAIPQGTCSVTFTISNNGPGAFNGILVIKDLVTPPPSPTVSLVTSSPGWSCSTSPPDTMNCATNSSVSLASGQTTTLSLMVKIPDGQFKNCASVKGYTQFPYTASTLIQESDFNNNESCVSMGGSGSSGCVTPPPGMVAWWPLDETSGNVVRSLVGNHDGITQSGPIGAGGPSVASAPKVGSALFFGVNKAEVPDNPALNFGTGDFSIDAWVRSYQSSLLSAVVDKLDTSTTTHRGYAFFVQNGMVQLRIGDGVSTGTYQSSKTFVADGTWRHVAVTMRRVGGIPVGQFYIDGVPAGGPFQPLAINLDNSAKLLIGSFRLANNACSCEVSLDEIELFNTALSPNAVKSIFQADKQGKCKPTISGMKFNDLNGNGRGDSGEPGLANWTIKVTDSSGNTQTATTDSAGNYSLTVSAGTYTVAEVLQSGWTQTAPTSGTYAVTVSGSQVVNNRDFGNKKQGTGSLAVTKTVENLPSPAPAGTTFPVTVSCLPSGPNVTVNLAAGGTETLNNIPVGSKCTVTEGPLPAPISSPTCGSLQWSAPTYSPGQTVTLQNSGSPQIVMIKNRLVCLGRPPVDTYAFTQGMNEFCIWGAGGSGSYNSPTPIDNPNSQYGLFNSAPLTGNNRDVRYGAIGLCYGRILSANDKFAFKYTFNAIPVAGLSYQEVNPVFIDGVFRGQVSETRRNVFGAGLSPIGLQLYFRPQSRIKPFVNTSGGFIFFKDQVPRLNGARFNFTYDVGAGVQVFRDAKRAFTLGYKYQNISNGGRALNNPGFNAHVFSFGYSIFNGRKIN